MDSRFPEQKKGLIFAGFTALLWGFLAIALKVSLNGLDPVIVVWFRFTVAFLILFIWLIFRLGRKLSVVKKLPWPVLVAALFLGLNYLGFITGINRTTPSNAQVFIQVGPVSFALAGIFIYREKVGWKTLMGFIMVLLGLAMFYYRQLSVQDGKGSEYTLGIVFIVGGGLSWAVFSSIQKFLVRNWDPNLLNLVIYGFCSLLFLPFIKFNQLIPLSFGDWLLLIFLGINTVLAYGFLALAIKYAEASRVSVIITLNPIITFIVMAILGEVGVSWIQPEHFTALSITGALCVLTGAVITILSRKKNNKHG